MGQELLVNAMLEGGQRLIDELPGRGLEVDSAFWMKPDDEEKWFLYIASPSLSTVELGPTYHKVNNVLREHPEWGIDFFDFVLVSENNPMAMEARTHAKGYLHPIPFRGSSLGGIPIQGAYIYSPRTNATVAA